MSKNRSFDVTIEYTRPSGGTVVAEYEIPDVSSANRAKFEARRAVLNDLRRSVETIHRVTAVETTPAPPKPTPIRAGDKLTVSIPFTGVVQHRDDGGVELLGPVVGAQGQRARRTMSRDRLEELVGRPLEPAPRRTRTEIVSIYPNGEQYHQNYPTRTSSYGVENLVQVRITRYADNGELVSKEFV